MTTSTGYEIITTVRMNDYDSYRFFGTVMEEPVISGLPLLGTCRIVLRNSPELSSLLKVSSLGAPQESPLPVLALAGSQLSRTSPLPLPIPSGAHGVVLVLTLARTFFSLTRRF